MTANSVQPEFLLGMTENEFFKIVLDKGLLALIALFFGFFLSRALERYKREQAVLQELGSQKVAALTEVMTLAIQLDGTVNLLMRVDTAVQSQRSADLAAKARDQMMALVDAANKHMFFLGQYAELFYWFSQLQLLRITLWTAGNRYEIASVDRDIQKMRKQMQELFRYGPDRGLSWPVRVVMLTHSLAKAK